VSGAILPGVKDQSSPTLRPSQGREIMMQLYSPGPQQVVQGIGPDVLDLMPRLCGARAKSRAVMDYLAAVFVVAAVTLVRRWRGRL
jgi:hypothetical protein